jgi:ABC-type bacteriocin/lantibiotic exporter with double-glycine peptidase domain
MKYTIIAQYCMAANIIIPILVVVLIAASSYLVYALLLRDFLSKRSINQTLEEYNIKKTPFEIIKEYYQIKNESLTDKQIQKIEKKYRQNEPEQFLTMYDAIRDNDKTRE